MVEIQTHGLDVLFSLIFCIDKDIIQIHNSKNIKFFREDLIDVVLKDGRNISESKKHHLILKIIVFGLKSYFPLIFFANPHPVIGTCEVKLVKPPNLF